jgi:hypothetical protein
MKNKKSTARKKKPAQKRSKPPKAVFTWHATPEGKFIMSPITGRLGGRIEVRD